MAEQNLPKNLLAQVRKAQQNEITEYHIYSGLAGSIKDKENSGVLKQIAEDELRHYEFWKKITGMEIKPKKSVIFFYTIISRLFGLTFGIKLMEKGEEKAGINYTELQKHIPDARAIGEDEDKHEQTLIGLINEELLQYVGSIVLGLNDALVELTGALAGFTFALQKSKLVVLAGLITGIAASFSMAASEYLSNKSDGEKTGKAFKSASYTGIAYIITVGLLVLPYLLFANIYTCLIITLAVALFIIFIFNYYVSIAKDFSFGKRFLEMAGISLGVAILSFGLGWVIRQTLGVDI